jgi:hypothetical protein
MRGLPRARCWEYTRQSPSPPYFKAAHDEVQLAGETEAVLQQ